MSGLGGSAVVGEPSDYLVRFGLDGATDPAFSEGGKLSLMPDPIAEGVAGRSLRPSNFAVDGAGRLLVFGDESVAGHAYLIPRTTEGQTAIESEAVVLRFDWQGRLDPTFGAGRVHPVFLRSALPAAHQHAVDRCHRRHGLLQAEGGYLLARFRLGP